MAGSPFETVYRTVTSLGSGLYSIDLTADDTANLGDLIILATNQYTDNTIVTSTVSPVIVQGSLTPDQETMLLEMYDLLGLDPTKPLVVTQTSRVAGTISQSIASNSTQTTVTRV